MIYSLEQIRRRCDKVEKGVLFSTKTIFGDRDAKYPIFTPTTYLRKWDFRDVPAEILAKYDLEPRKSTIIVVHISNVHKKQEIIYYIMT